jgi:hypothetical protein
MTHPASGQSHGASNCHDATENPSRANQGLPYTSDRSTLMTAHRKCGEIPYFSAAAMLIASGPDNAVATPTLRLTTALAEGCRVPKT